MKTKALKIENLKKIYSNDVHALNGIDLDVEQGEFFGLLGPNGAGKSTTIGIITSLVNKTSGSVSIFGYDLDREKTKAKTFIGLVPQEFNFGMFEKNIDIIVNQAGFYGIPRKLALQKAKVIFKKLGLWEKRNKTARSLSGGMKRRLMIARALMHEPKMLILDEPTAGVDIELRRELWDFLRELNASGTTIILTTHYLEEAELLCHRVAIIDQGDIIKDTTVKKLINSLATETIILDLKNPITSLIQIPECTIEMLDETTLSLTFPKKFSLNDIFAYFTAKNISIVSMRNKTNRLEELFIKLIKGKK